MDPQIGDIVVHYWGQGTIFEIVRITEYYYYSKHNKYGYGRKYCRLATEEEITKFKL